MHKYQIIIKDNETGEELLNRDTKCVVGAVQTEKGAVAMCCAECDTITLAITSDAARRSADVCLSSNRTARVMAAVLASQKTTELTDEEGREALKRAMKHEESEDFS